MNNNSSAPIPVGFRFHPTDEELVGYYLHGKVGRSQRDHLIQELDLYKIEPWDLSEVCRIGDDAPEKQSDWYFFSHKDKKYPTGNRANRATSAGFWKATGRDKPIHTQHRHVIGMRKTLVFYRGRAPHGLKTDWIMHEFRLHDAPPHVHSPPTMASPAQTMGPSSESDGWVVCRVFQKTKSFKTKSQDTSCSFEEDQQLCMSSPEKGGLFPDVGAAPSSTLHHHHHFNHFSCKQELSVDDYGTPSNINMNLHDPFLDSTANLHHLQDQLHHHHHHHSLIPPSLATSSSSSFKDLDARVTSRAEGSCFGHPGVQLQSHHQNDSAEFWMRRADQTLADVTCHVHVKRQSAAEQHENNLVHLWNV